MKGEKGVATISQVTVFELLSLVQVELLLFAAVLFAIGLIDELAVDLAYVWFRLNGRAKTQTICEDVISQSTLSGIAAVFIPAWREEAVIGSTLTHALSSWRQADLRRRWWAAICPRRSD